MTPSMRVCPCCPTLPENLVIGFPHISSRGRWNSLLPPALLRRRRLGLGGVRLERRAVHAEGGGEGEKLLPGRIVQIGRSGCGEEIRQHTTYPRAVHRAARR